MSKYNLIIDDAETLGTIARMNKLPCIPTNDSKLQDLILESISLGLIENANKIRRSWVRGWTKTHIEYFTVEVISNI